jgi:hypothetical protein
MSNNIHPSRIFKTPEELEEAFKGYKKQLNQQSMEWLKVQYVGKDGERREDPQKVPMTLEGFKRYCRENHGDVSEYFLNRDGYYDDFTIICLRIKDEIRENQIVGGLLGFYNPSITQRLNGLTEKVETDNTHKAKIEITLDLNK